MAAFASFFNKFLSFFIIFVHLGCFIFTITTDDSQRHDHPSKKRKLSNSSPNKTHKALSSSWSFLKRIFSSKSCQTSIQTHPSTPARSSQNSIVLPEADPTSDPPRKNSSIGSCPESDISTRDHLFFPLRNDIFPCTTCGEIFQKPQLLDQHQAVKHAVSELIDGDSGKNIVQIIFKTGWTDNKRSPIIYRILKIHNSPKILTWFEEYREVVKANAGRNGVVWKRDERCIADGNELLGFQREWWV